MVGSHFLNVVPGDRFSSSHVCPPPAYKVGNYTLLSINRAGSNAYDFVYKARLTNNTTIIAVAATATLLQPKSSKYTIVQGVLNFGDVQAKATISSLNTFTIRRNKREALSKDDLKEYLKWQVSTGSAPVNTPPVANTTSTPTVVNVGNTVNLDASASTDANSDPLSYAWTLTAVPTGSTALNTLTNAASSIATFGADKAGTYTAEVAVSDGKATTNATLTIIVTTPPPANTPPVAKAAIANPTATTIGQTVQLDSTGSTDSDGNPIAYTWTLTVPPGSSTTLSDSKIANPTFKPDLGGTYTAQLIVNDGMADSTPATATISVSSVSVMITSPPGQSTIAGDSVSIQGLVAGMSNVGVTVSGAHHPAVVLDNVFVATDVPIQIGPNTITVTATDATTGQTATATIDITGTGPAPVSITAEPETGVAPLPVSFNVVWQSQWIPTQITADYNGDGTVDYTSADLAAKPAYTYQASGLYQASFVLTDAQGVTQTVTVPVVIQDEAALDQKFQAIWGEFTGNLSLANATGAANYFLPESRDKYLNAFNALGSKLPSIVSTFSALTKTEITGSYGEYLVTRNINGTDYAFFVYFRQASDGTWGLESL